ncbi:MAG: acetyl-CoA synthetase [Acidimicrobiales bacterium]
MGSKRNGRTPCLIGAGRRTWRAPDCGPDGAPEPLLMWEEVARLADHDTGGAGAADRFERIDVVYGQAWQYDDPVGRLSERLGAKPSRSAYSGIGGTVPQTLLADASRDILRGDLDLALVVGGEALASRRRLAKEGRKPDWSFRPDKRRPFPLDVPPHPGEVTHSIFEAWLTFALFENARRAHLGSDLTAYRRSLGELLAPMTAVAAANPYAWFPTARSVDEVIGPTVDNRMVGYPYAKLMTAIMDVDMAAAVIVASDAMADSMGVPLDRRVYLRGWGYAEDPPAVAGRLDLWRSGAMQAAGAAALQGAGAGVDDVAHFDLYSCFASSIEFSLDALGIDPAAARSRGPEVSPERPISVTGGLAYHGGPGSNYMTHSLATMVEELRRDPGSLGMVSGVGMHINKHVFAAYSTEPGVLVPPDDSSVSAQGAMDQATIVESFEGPARVATYSVIHGRDGAPEWAALVCDVSAEDGTAARCYARLSDPGALTEAEQTELIGRSVQLVSVDGHTEARL